MGITAVPVKRTGMTVALLTGIQGRTVEEWSQYCTELNEAVTSSISFSYQYGPSGIRPYDLTQSNTTNSKRHSLRRKRQNLSKMLLQHDSLTTPTVDKERPHSHSPTNGDRSCGETNAGFQGDPQSPGLSARTESKEDTHVHYTCEGKPITTVTDVSKLLKRLKLEDHMIVFKERSIDGHALFKLSEQILEKEYNFKRVDSVKLMSFIRTGHIPK